MIRRTVSSSGTTPSRHHESSVTTTAPVGAGEAEDVRRLRLEGAVEVDGGGRLDAIGHVVGHGDELERARPGVGVGGLTDAQGDQLGEVLGGVAGGDVGTVRPE